MRFVKVLFAVLALAGCAGTPADQSAVPPANGAVAQPIPASFAVPQPGTRLMWAGQQREATGEIEIIGIEGKTVLSLWQGQPIIRYGVFAFGPEGGRQMRRAMERFWPLEVGNVASYTRQEDGKPFWNDSLEVIAFEEVTVPAGTYDAYVVRYITEARNGEWAGALTSWYAPKVSWSVKNVFTATDGTRRSQVLLAVTEP